jgi:hypothetical protein
MQRPRHKHAVRQDGGREKTKMLLWFRSNCQTRTTFGTPRADNSAASAGFHTHAESVRPFAPSVRRLVGPFHGVRPVKVKSPLLQPLTPVSVNVRPFWDISNPVTGTLVDNYFQKR